MLPDDEEEEEEERLSSYPAAPDTRCITSSQVMYGRHYKIIGNYIKRNITTKVILVKMTTQGDMKRNVRKATEKTGG